MVAFDLGEFHWPMAEAAKQGKIQRMAASWKTSKMGSRQYWQDRFLIIHINGKMGS